MLIKAIHRINMRPLRRILRGYRTLNKMNTRNEIFSIHNSLAVIDCVQSKKISRNIFGIATSESELLVRQYTYYLFGYMELQKSILYALGKPGSAIVHPMPPSWNVVLEKAGLKVDKIRSKLLWNLAMLFALAQGFGVIGRTIIQGVKEVLRPNYNKFGRYTYFDQLVISNLPSSDNENKINYNIITWYQQWDGRIRKLDSMGHSIKGTDSSNVGTVPLNYLPSAIPPINTINGLVEYTAWAIKASLLAGIDLFRGRWWHALLLNQAAMSAHVRIMSADLLAREYMFHNANWIYRPLWTYEVEAKGCLVTFYFYSSNCEPFKLKSGYPKQIYGWQNLNWPRYLVWDDYQSSFVKRVVGDGASVKVVGCIWFSDGRDDFRSTTKHNIAVFDVTPQRLSFSVPQRIGDFNFYIPKVCNQFLLDIQQTSLEQQYNMLWKRKRNIGSLAQPSYRLLCESLLSLQNVRCVDTDISAIQVIEECDLVISMPFTSTALIAREMNKPSVYYDPLGLCQKGDRAAHGIEILQGKNELESWILAQG